MQDASPVGRSEGTGHFLRTKAGAERDAQILELVSEGLPYRQVATMVGLRSTSGIADAVTRALAAIPARAVEQHRRIQLDRLDFMYREAIAVLRRFHYVPITSGPEAGHLVHDPDGQPLMDDAPVLGAIDRLLKIEERRAKLLGLDAPTRSTLTVIPMDAITARIAELELDLELNDGPDTDGRGRRAGAPAPAGLPRGDEDPT